MRVNIEKETEECNKNYKFTLEYKYVVRIEISLTIVKDSY